MSRRAMSAGASDTAGELLERAAELAALRTSLETVRRSAQGRVVLVKGEAGVGKTALLRQFCEESGRTSRVLWGGCDPLFTPRPLGPLLAVAERAGGDLEQVVGTDVMPHKVVASLVRELCAQPSTVFVLEDVHWADEATLDVLRLLARRVNTVPALIVASYRDDELDRAHPLRIVLGELATSQAITRLTLAALSRAAVTQLAEPHAVDADELFRKTAGNPFFVVEVLAAHADEMPDTVRDAVLARAARLSPPARILLEAAAIVPPQGELWLLEAIAGEVVGSLDECLTSGMLTSELAGVAFRHELARLAIEESIALNRRIDLHRSALIALADPPRGVPDLARLAHHAEAAGDVDAVLRFAPAAAERAATLGAHREAAANYERALRFGAQLDAAERAHLLECRSRECLVTDQYDQGIAAIEEAIECRRVLGDSRRVGDGLRQLSEFLWCPGRTAEAERAGRDAISMLESLPPCRELALAYVTFAEICKEAARMEEAVEWGERALHLAEDIDDTEITVRALTTIGVCADDYDKIQEGLERARRAGLDQEVARAYLGLSEDAVERRRHSVASAYMGPGLAYCSERGLELFRLYFLASRARFELNVGRWSEAAETAALVLRIPRTSTTPRILALVVLALVRARRGDPEVWSLLDEAWALAEPTGELPRLGPVSAARAEAAWLEGRLDAVAAGTEAAFDLAVRRRYAWVAGELACWRRRVGVDEHASTQMAEPYALELAGEYDAAARLWTHLGCPYEAALSLAQADEEPSQRRALEELSRLGARPAAAIVARRLRKQGARGLPRGPRPTTRENAAGLTARELEVLALVAQGLRNPEIARRLFLATKTVDHHVSAILGKLRVGTRSEAGTAARRLGIELPTPARLPTEVPTPPNMGSASG